MDFDPRDYDSRDEDRYDATRDRSGRGGSERDDARSRERERDERPRDANPRAVFTRHLDLPRGLERELVRDREREYTLRGSESRTLATVGAFRVVSSRDLRDYNDRPTDLRSGDLRHLCEQGLVETVRVPGYREQAVTLTKEGRSLLEHHMRCKRVEEGVGQGAMNGEEAPHVLDPRPTTATLEAADTARATGSPSPTPLLR